MLSSTFRLYMRLASILPQKSQEMRAGAHYLQLYRKTSAVSPIFSQYYFILSALVSTFSTKGRRLKRFLLNGSHAKDPR